MHGAAEPVAAGGGRARRRRRWGGGGAEAEGPARGADAGPAEARVLRGAVADAALGKRGGRVGAVERGGPGAGGGVRGGIVPGGEGRGRRWGRARERRRGRGAGEGADRVVVVQADGDAGGAERVGAGSVMRLVLEGLGRESRRRGCI